MLNSIMEHIAFNQCHFICINYKFSFYQFTFSAGNEDLFKIDENLGFFINFRELRDFLNILENQFNLEIFEKILKFPLGNAIKN